MSPVRSSSLISLFMLSLLLMALSGCGDSNSQAVLNPVTGTHPATWLPAGHTTAAKANLTSCATCHGSDFSGGISKVACTQCHLGNALSPHPLVWNTAWGSYAYALHPSYVKQNTSASCANVNCHGVDLRGVAGSGPSCISCHLGGVSSIHPTDWAIPTAVSAHTAYVVANGTASCFNAVCHGTQGEGVFLSGPSCKKCHF